VTERLKDFLLVMLPAILALAGIVCYRIGFLRGHDAAMREVVHALHEKHLVDEEFWTKAGKP
jgi:hypothetical protein